MRILGIVLACLLLLAAPALSEEEADYVSDFSYWADGWYARSNGGASVFLTDHGAALGIEGRTADWHSMGREFTLAEGESYQLSVLVRQDEADEARFVLSVAHSHQGQESYENIAVATAKRGEWTEISGTYLAGQYERFVLYVETQGAATLSYAIKDFVLRGKTQAFGAEDLPSLAEAYKAYFPFGTAVTYMEAVNRPRMDFYASQFNILTPGNELKPDSVLNVAVSRMLAAEDETAVAVHLTAAKPILDYAQEKGIPVHGHVLVWHSQTPKAFFHEGYDPRRPMVGREVMLGRLEHYIEAVFKATGEQYPGLIVSWDVVNEAVEDGKTSLRDSLWKTVIGDDYVERAFEFARKHAPKGVKLYYNDYNTAYEPKQTGIANLLNKLQEAGNVDGYGFQMHHDIRQPGYRAIEKAFKRIAALGLCLRISELDVTVPDPSEASFAAQAKLYGQVMKLALSYADQVDAVQVWGVMDDLSWRAKSFPLLFDAWAKPKPAFYAVLEAVQD